MRAVIYARYSSENQREASIEDQIEICRRYIAQQGWTHTQTYDDRAASGASTRLRPGFQRMLADAEAGRFDVLVCEAIDRLGRKLADVADLFDRLSFRGVRVRATSIGLVTQMHIGIMGTMAQMMLADLREKQPMLQFSTPEQIGATAAFLCSNGAATITGAPISVDGGWVAQ